MPTINFQLSDLSKLTGKKITPEELSDLAHYFKGELGSYDKKTDEAAIELDDTNLPYLWSVEGMARLLRGVFKTEKGLAKIKVEKSKYDIIADESTNQIRPFIAAFVAKGRQLDDYLLKQLIQLQEKYCEGYGRKRQKASTGIYSYKKIKWPVIYKAVPPQNASFVPLGLDHKLDLNGILEHHPKGKEYAWILKDAKKFPVLVDSAGEYLSFVPIINSSTTGKLQPGDSDILFEVTGTESEPVMLAANIFAYALFERGFKIQSVNIKSKKATIATPTLKTQKAKISRQEVKSLLGLDMTEPKTKELLERSRYGFKDYTVEIPSYRADTMHNNDIIEDIAIMYGFENLEPLQLTSYTTGKKLPIVPFVDKIREIFVGLGHQEIMSQILTNKNNLYEKMSTPDAGTVEIESYMSELYSAVRTYLTPTMLEVLSKNRHVEYPHKIFEEGLATERKGEEITDFEKIAAASSHSDANFTEAKQAVEYLFSQIAIKYELKESEKPFFIVGRAATIIVGGLEVGYFGEVKPEVLKKWNIEMPVWTLELNLSKLFLQ